MSLALLGLLSLLMFQGVFSGKRVWESLEEREARLETVEGAQTALRNRLMRAYPHSRYDATIPYVDFLGEAEVMRFVSPPPMAQQPAALRRYTLGLTTKGDLVLASASDLALDARVASERTVLLSNVRSVQFDYWGAAPPDEMVRWRPNWRTRPTLPKAIRIRVEFMPGDKRFWPELLVEPMATLAIGCLIDPATGLCSGPG